MNNADPHTTPHTPPAAYSAFAPLLVTLIGLIVLLGWNLRITLLQRSNLQAAKFQVWQTTLQSQQTEEKLKAMLTDLLALAATEKDPDALAIARRYNIKQNK